MPMPTMLMVNTLHPLDDDHSYILLHANIYVSRAHSLHNAKLYSDANDCI